MSAERLPGKPLLKVNGIPIISHVVKKAKETQIGEVIVATEDEVIVNEVKKYKGDAILTSRRPKTGTDRIWEALQKLNIKNIDFIINLQGDEPLITKDSINKIVSMLPDLEKTQNLILNGITPVNSEEAFDPNNVKCAVINANNKVLYFSRKPLLNSEDSNINGTHYFKQLGLYAMSFNTLKKFAALKQSNLEKS